MDTPSVPEKRRLRWPRYLLAGVLLAGILHAVPLEEIRNAFRGARPLPLIAAFAIFPLARLLLSVRTRAFIAMQGISLSLLHIFEISCASTMYGVALPGSYSGGIVRWYRLSGPEGKRSGALAAVAAERVVDFLVLSLFGILCWAADTHPDRMRAPAWVLAAAAAACIAAAVPVFTSFGGLDGNKVERFARRIRFLPASAAGAFSRVVDGFSQYREMGCGRLAMLLGVSLAFHALVTASYWLMAVSLGIEISPPAAGWIRAFILFVTAVPLTPSGLGVREVGLVMLLAPLGISPAEAVAFSLLQFAALLPIALFGAAFDVRRYLRP